MPTTVAIVGAAGYTGAELIEILALHEDADLVALFGSHRSSAATSADVAPRLNLNLPINPFTHDALLASGARVVFLATPHEVSAEAAPALLDAGLIVIDLSGAFRLSSPDDARAHYGLDPAPSLNPVYALPELNRHLIPSTNLLSCPGCYATASILALRPLADANLIAAPPSISAVSGISGAGRTPSPTNHFSELSLQPYKALSHRHQPEIAEHARTPVHFVPHVAPFNRGIVATIHITLKPNTTAQDLNDAFTSAYAHEPFIRLRNQAQAGGGASGGGGWPSVRAVERTNLCDIAWTVAEDHAVVVAAIDNLVKGASGQAVQAMNARLGLPETSLGPYSPPRTPEHAA